MELTKLKALLDDLSPQEKLGQLLQLEGSFFGDEETFATGPARQLGLTEADKWLCGSVLNLEGAEEARALQERYMQRHPHHIPLLLMLDVINGYRTVYPIPLAQGCMFSPELMRCAARATAREATAAGLHLTFSPMADLVQDSRWGRVMESTGEDPYLNSLCAAALVEGYQGDDLSAPDALAACVKHFAAYGHPEAGREYAAAELSPRTLYEDYLPAYQAAIQAGAAMVMTGFHTLDRVPATANQWLMQTVLRRQMGFSGVLISDYAAIAELVNHGIARDDAEAALLAMRAGVDIDMMTSTYVRQLPALLRSGQLPQQALDDAVWRVLVLKNRLGLFEQPYHGADPVRAAQVTLCPDHLQLARQLACRSMVLLKNEDDLLPLAGDGRIAFIGPYAESGELYGAWSMQGRAQDTVTLRAAAQAAGLNAVFCPGCALLEPGTVLDGFGGCVYTEPATAQQSDEWQTQAVQAARQADTVVLCLGEQRFQSGEGGSRTSLTLPPRQQELLRRVCAVNRRVVLVLFSGRPMEIAAEAEACGAVLAAWFPGTAGGQAVLDLLLGRCAPEGRLAMCFPRCVGQLPLSYRALSTGRPCPAGQVRSRFFSRYQDVENTPLYPFGYGLSYTRFAYSAVRLSAKRLCPGQTLTVSATVTNTGKRAGVETAQLYVQDRFGSVCRPQRELKGFAKVALAPGESQEVRFLLGEEQLRFFDREMRYTSEPGEFWVWIGENSACGGGAAFWLDAAPQKEG